jgi:hypothetical protein
MSGFVEGIDRSQSTLFPAMLDDYVAALKVSLAFLPGFPRITLFAGVRPPRRRTQ